jgi:hypothetical protein
MHEFRIRMSATHVIVILAALFAAAFNSTAQTAAPSSVLPKSCAADERPG